MTHFGSTSHYAGDISAIQAWDILKTERNAILLDVRTETEWQQGMADLSELDKSSCCITWRTLPAMAINPEFLSQVEATLPDKTSPVLLLCKAGGRSMEAAMALTAQGYGQCYNIVGGFEDEAGWKDINLPWRA